MNISSIIKTDILVIGGGIAGLMAAIRAADKGADVLIAEKAHVLRGGSGATGNDHFLCHVPELHGDISVAIREVANSQTALCGEGRMIRYHMEHAFDIVREWHEWGINMKPSGTWHCSGHAFPGRPKIWLKYSGHNQKAVLEAQAKKRGVRFPNHHPAIVEKSVFDTVQASQLRFSQPNKKKRDYPLKGKAFCGCCGHALSRTMQKTSYYYCRHSEADVESRCHKMRLNAAELEQAVFLTLKKQMEAAAPFAPDGSLRVDASVPERAEYEQQIETLQDGKRTLYEHYLMGEIDLNTYKAEKAACNELLLKTKNAYAAVLAQAKQKQDEQARQDSRKEASKAIFDADTLTTELAELLIDRVLVYPDKRIEIAYKIQDIFD